MVVLALGSALTARAMPPLQRVYVSVCMYSIHVCTRCVSIYEREREGGRRERGRERERERESVCICQSLCVCGEHVQDMVGGVSLSVPNMAAN